jgi:hypothetical protein
MEWWILLGLVGVVLAIGGLSRLHRSRRRRTPERAQNIYPLW